MRITRSVNLSAFALIMIVFVLLATPVAATYPSTSQTLSTLGTSGNILEAPLSQTNPSEYPSKAAVVVEADTAAWSSTGSMIVARIGPTATLLNSGKVLVVGGSNGGALANAELYDPMKSTWSSVESMSLPRGGHTASLLTSGKVLVAGGCQNSAEVYNPDSNTWTSAGTVIRRGTPTATRLPSGKVLVVGGWDCSGGNAGLSSAELYDPDMNTWSPAASMRVRRGDFAATLLPSGKVLVMGGFSLDGWGGLSSTELYDPDTNTWSPAASMGSPRESHSATLLPSGKVMVAGGGTTIHPNLASAELYDPASNTWATAASMRIARGYHSAILLSSGKVLVVGGAGGSYSFTSLASAELYDPDSTTWSPLTSMSVARVNHTAIRLGSGSVLVAGGEAIGSNIAFASAELFGSGFTISGRITRSDGISISGVTLSIGTTSAISESDGSYAFTGLLPGSYTLTPSLEGYTFSPPNQTLTLDADKSGVNFSATPITQNTQYPIILLPGIMGTRLSTTNSNNQGCSYPLGGENIWIDLFSRSKLPLLQLNESGVPLDYGVTPICPDGALKQFTPLIDIYNNFLIGLSSDGYPYLEYPGYDWRLDLEDSAVKLDQFIQAHKGSASKVILIGHSMGGLLARQYISNPSRAKNVQQVISVGSPYFGAPKLAYAMLSGQTGLKIDFGFLLDDLIKGIIRNSPGSMQLLPSRAYFAQKGGYLEVKGHLLKTYEETDAYFKLHNRQNFALLDRAYKVHNGYEENGIQYPGLDNFSDLNGIKYTVLTSSTFQTMLGVQEFPCPKDNRKLCQKPTKEYYLGDDTVPWASARLQGATLAPTVQVCTLKNITKGHPYLMSDPVVLTTVKKVLDGNTLSSECKERQPLSGQATQNDISLAESTAPFIQVEVQGSGKVTVLDADGHRTGPDPDGYIQNDIPFVTYTPASWGVILVLPTSTTYQLTIEQQDNEPNRVWVTDYRAPTAEDNFTPHAQANFMDIPSTQGGKAEMAINFAAGLPALRLSVTDSGGGQPVILPPTSILDEQQSQDVTMPATTFSVQGGLKGPFSVTLAAADNESGVLKTEYSLNGGQSWQTYHSPVKLVANARFVIYARSVDKAGNFEYPWISQQIGSPYAIYLPLTLH